MSKENMKARRLNPPLVKRDDEPLMRILIAEATRRGETLAALAEHLGVSYERLAQWRRGEASTKTAHRTVHARAAEYLGIPVVVVLVLAGIVSTEDFIWPGADLLEVRLQRELEMMRQDPLVAAFVPASLAAAPPELKIFVVWLYREIQSVPGAWHRGQQWFAALHRTAAVSGKTFSGDEFSNDAGKAGLF